MVFVLVGVVGEDEVSFGRVCWGGGGALGEFSL
jgi:hypothetical protein